MVIQWLDALDGLAGEEVFLSYDGVGAPGDTRQGLADEVAAGVGEADRRRVQRDTDRIADAVELHFGEEATAAAEEVANLHKANLARRELLAEHRHPRLPVVELLLADDVVPQQRLFELVEVLGGG